MPELPEVETMRRGILGVVGSTIADVWRCDCRLKPIRIRPRFDALKRRAVGQMIVAVDRLGKRVIMRLESDDVVVFEPRMTGLVLLADPPSIEHLRIEFSLHGGPHRKLWYWDRRGLGSVQLLSPDALDDWLGPEKLGPDALFVTPELLRSRLGKSRREIKTALLDQRAVAGIGNLYASEILHLANVHPQKRCDRLTRRDWQRITEAILYVMNEAIRCEGSTLSDGTYRNALNKAGGYQNHHLVYNRADQTCRSCGSGDVVRIVQAQRSTFFCPVCQPKRRSRRK